MKSLKRLIFTAVFCISAILANAQRGPAYQADMAFMKGDYFDAATLYKKAFSKEKNKAKKAEIIFKTAECYRMTNDVKNQEAWYLKALKAGIKDPEAIVRYADALKASGKYSEAVVQYQKFMTANPGDKRGEIGVRTCEQAQKWKDKPTRARIDNLAAINTKYNDFGAAYAKKDHRTIVFTSSRQEAMGKANDGGTGEKFQDLFEATVDKKGKWSTPRALTAPLNTEANDGAAFLDSRGNDMFFTRCEVEKGKYGNCQIYFTTRLADSWEAPKLIPLAADSFTVGQPCLSPDGKFLYFVSDMKGGIGGKDIWVSEYDKTRKEWGTPKNLGPIINTPTDDMFPFLTSDNTLYFSSKGHLGMGGLDIFKAKRAGESWKTPENLKYPINTSFDDFAYIIDELNPDKGFLSSNRPSGKGGDDVYSWYLAPLTFTISGRVYDLDTKEPLAGTSIELFGSDGSSIPFKTDATGNYKFDLKPETKYKISASQRTYLNKYLEVSTVGLEQSKDFIGDFDFALRSTLRAIELPEVYYDLAKWDLRPESKKSLDGLVQILTENPTITIELGSHTDSRPIPMTNDTLSQRRAESVVAYLIKAGIQPERLVAKGYGATQPRTLDKDRGSFKKGDRLDEAFINALPTKEQKEEAHQLNRRTEFRVLKTNYMDPNSSTEIVQETAPAPVTSTETATKVEVQEAPKVAEPAGPGEIYYCKKTDTYNSVAKQYSITVKDLKALNGIKTEQVYEGMELKVEMNGDYTDYDKKFYVLEKGDDGFKTVAKKLNMKEGDLKKLNKGMSDTDFRIGKRIRIAAK